jgi:hypothetical protein
MSSKVCPVCERSWGDTFKFCPEDGAALEVAKPAPAGRKGVDRRADAARSAPTVVMDAAATPTEAPAPERKKRKGFSETAWFMQKIDPTMVDPVTGRVVADTTATPAEDIDPETRKRYSLRGEDEE